jgi:hypothetical protein
MSKIVLFSCAIVLTASLAVGQQHSAATPRRSARPGSDVTTGGPGCTGSGPCTKGKASGNTLPRNGASGISGQSRLSLGRAINQATAKAKPHPGTPDFINGSITNAANLPQ